MLSPVWQITFVFAADAPATGLPLSDMYVSECYEGFDTSSTYLGRQK